MKVLLIYANKPRITFGFLPGPYGLEILRARLNSLSIESDIVNPFLSHDPKSLIEKSISPDTCLIGISLRNIDDALVLWDADSSGGKIQTVSSVEDAKDVLAWCRKYAPDVPVVLGGAAVLHMPEQLLTYLRTDDNIFVDSEHGFVKRALRIAFNKDGIGQAKRIIDTKHPENILRENVYFRFREEAAVRTYTGCPLSCSHCIEHVGSRVIRRAQVVDVANEVEAAVTNHSGVRRIFFADSEVNLAGECRTKELITEIRTRTATKNIPLAGYFNPRPMGFELLKYLSENRVKVLLTVDHVSNAILQRNGKNFRKRHLESLVIHHRELGLELSFCLLLGQPGETRESVDEVLRFVDSIPAEICGTIYFSPGVRVYPGTPLERQLSENKLDARWLHGTRELQHSFIKPVVYCESWDPFELFEYVSARSGGRIVPMNAYMHDTQGQTMHVLQEEFENYHIGLAEAQDNISAAWRAWSGIRTETPFLSGNKHIDFLWERGRLALENGAPDKSLSDWTYLQSLLVQHNTVGAGLEKLAHNIGVANQLLRTG